MGQILLFSKTLVFVGAASAAIASAFTSLPIAAEAAPTEFLFHHFKM